MNYDKTKKVLERLSDLLFEINLLSIQVTTANNYNLRNSIPELEINVQELIDEKTELELEFNRTKKEL